MKNFYSFLIILCIHSVYGQRTPTISHITQKPIKDIGDTVDLICSVAYGMEFPVLWDKYDKKKATEPVLLSTGRTLFIKDSRFSLSQETDITLQNDIAYYTLQIKDIQETDAGIYRCQVSLGLDQKISAEVELVVRQPPIISDNSTRSLIVMEGQNVRLECYAGGFPLPRVLWRRENNAILPTGGSMYRSNILKIPNITKENRGTYYCVAENGVGRGARRNIAVEVEFSPVITVSKPRLGQALQYDMDLVCHVEAYPPPAIIWLNNGVQLTNNQHFEISHFATGDEFTDSTIRIITIEKRQYGEYICRASNVLGTSEVIVHLYETIIPVCPPACNQQTSHNSNNKNGGIQIDSTHSMYLITLYILYFTQL